MSRPAAARTLHPLANLVWGMFLAWSVWMGLVWLLGIGPIWLGLSSGSIGGGLGLESAAAEVPRVSAPELRQAVAVLAGKAEIAWLALALANLHLSLAGTHGLPTARRWLGLAAGCALAFGALNAAVGVPFGWVQFREPLSLTLGSSERLNDLRLFGVPMGWLLLWVVLAFSAREAVLHLHPRVSHLVATLLAAVAVTATLLNLEPIAGHWRAWWRWYDVIYHQQVPFRWWTAFGWLACAWLTLFFLRERNVMAAAARRPVRPLLILAILNLLALAAHLRHALR